MTQDLQGKTAVVTGGSKGIGYAIADALAAAGCNVMISARHEDEVQHAARTLSDRHPGTVVGMVCDVRKHEEVRQMIAAAVARFGGLDVLVNNAGVGKFGPMGELTPDDWHQVIETNLDGVFYCCHEAIPHLRKRDDSWIINIASLASFIGLHEVAAYTASKAGVAGLTRALAVEWGPRGVNVNAIAPGVFRTALNTRILDESGRGQEFLMRTPLKRFGRVEELAPACVFLASEGSSFVNGEVLTVDGGFLASGVNQ